MIQQEKDAFKEMIILPIEKLSLRAIKYRMNLKHMYGYDINLDSRLSILEIVNRILLNHNINTVLFINHICEDSYLEKELNYTIKSDCELLKKDYLLFTRFNLIILFQSNTESFMRRIHYAIKKKKSFKYSTVIDDIFTHFNMNKDSDHYKAINLLNIIRNTIHNNGVHTLGTKAVIYKKKEISFLENKRQHISSYPMLFDIFTDIIDLIFLLGEYTNEIELIEGIDSRVNNNII